MRRREWLASVGLAMVVAACGGRPVQVAGEGGDRVTAEVSLGSPAELAADAELELWLSDAAEPASRIAEGRFPATGRAWPLLVALRYDDDRIADDHTYVLKAAVVRSGRVLYGTQADTLVITRGHADRVRLVLQPIEVPTSGTPPSAAASGLAGTSWRLEDLGGTAVVTGADATLDFLEDDRVAGSGSCNRFTGTAKISDGAIAFGALTATQMGCAEAVTAQEDRYLKALGTAERYTIEGGALVIFSKGLPSPLRFVRRPMAPEVTPPA